MYYSNIGQAGCATLALKGDQVLRLSEFRKILSSVQNACNNRYGRCNNREQVRQTLVDLNITSEQIAKNWNSNFTDNNQNIALQLGGPSNLLLNERLLWAPRNVAEAINLHFGFPVYNLEQEFSQIKFIGYCLKGGDFFGFEPTKSPAYDQFNRGGYRIPPVAEPRQTGPIVMTPSSETRRDIPILSPTVETRRNIPYQVSGARDAIGQRGFKATPSASEILPLPEFGNVMYGISSVQTRQALIDNHRTPTEIARNWRINRPSLSVRVYPIGWPINWMPRNIAQAINWYFGIQVYDLDREFDRISYSGEYIGQPEIPSSPAESRERGPVVILPRAFPRASGPYEAPPIAVPYRRFPF